MNPARQKHDPARRRYLVHLLCVLDGDCESCRYIARIRPWAARSSIHAELGSVTLPMSAN